jgi:hypothetical protein
MASSNEYARKILNSPQYAEPCIVASGRQILGPKNWFAFSRLFFSKPLMPASGYSLPESIMSIFVAA